MVASRSAQLIAVIAVAMVVAGCTAERSSPSASPSASRTASPSPSSTPPPSPEPSSGADPAPEPSVFPSPQVPSEGTATDGWTYAQLSSICQDWVLTRAEQNANEVWNFDAGYPAQRYGAVWDLAFDGTFTLPGETATTPGFIGCAVSGTPADYSVAVSEASGDTAPDEVLRP